MNKFNTNRAFELILEGIYTTSTVGESEVIPTHLQTLFRIREIRSTPILGTLSIMVALKRLTMGMFGIVWQKNLKTLNFFGHQNRYVWVDVHLKDTKFLMSILKRTRKGIFGLSKKELNLVFQKEALP